MIILLDHCTRCCPNEVSTPIFLWIAMFAWVCFGIIGMAHTMAFMCRKIFK